MLSTGGDGSFLLGREAAQEPALLELSAQGFWGRKGNTALLMCVSQINVPVSRQVEQ